MSDDKKYFWLRLKKDFFKRHDIQIIESMPNGKEFILFYLKLLCESIDHNGLLRFSDDIPYSEDMLATITNTDKQIVYDALGTFHDFGMIEILDDGTFYLKQVESMTGCETEWAKKKRQYRENLKTEKGQVEDKPRTKKDNVRQEIEKEIEIDKELEIEKDKKHIYGAYHHVRLKESEIEKLKQEIGEYMTDECITYLDEYIEMKGTKYKSHYLVIKKWVVDAVKEKNKKKPMTDEEKTQAYLKAWEDA